MSGVIHSPEFIAGKENCDHVWGSSHDPDLPVYFIRQCLVCNKIDGDDLRSELEEAGWARLPFTVEEIKDEPLRKWLKSA